MNQSRSCAKESGAPSRWARGTMPDERTCPLSLASMNARLAAESSGRGSSTVCSEAISDSCNGVGLGQLLGLEFGHGSGFFIDPALDLSRHGLQRRHREHGANRDLQVERGLDPGEQMHDQQRVPAQVEEV